MTEARSQPQLGSRARWLLNGIMRFASDHPQAGSSQPFVRSKSPIAFWSNSLGFPWRFRYPQVWRHRQQERAGSGEWSRQNHSPPIAQTVTTESRSGRLGSGCSQVSVVGSFTKGLKNHLDNVQLDVFFV